MLRALLFLVLVCTFPACAVYQPTSQDAQRVGAFYPTYRRLAHEDDQEAFVLSRIDGVSSGRSIEQPVKVDAGPHRLRFGFNGVLPGDLYFGEGDLDFVVKPGARYRVTGQAGPGQATVWLEHPETRTRLSPPVVFPIRGVRASVSPIIVVPVVR